jgi:hypothetical protein
MLMRPAKANEAGSTRSSLKESRMALTGHYDFRRTITGQLRLWVEYDSNGFWDFLTRKKTYCRRWRNATIMDLTAPQLRHLMDMRFTGSQRMPQARNTMRDRPEHVPEREKASIRVLLAPPDGEYPKSDPLLDK